MFRNDGWVVRQPVAAQNSRVPKGVNWRQPPTAARGDKANSRRFVRPTGMKVADLWLPWEREAITMSAQRSGTSKHFSTSELDRWFVAKGDELLTKAKRVSKTITQRVQKVIIRANEPSGPDSSAPPVKPIR
jgi:hypothetical protein